MPIYGLTDIGAKFPHIASLRKGAPKPNEKQPGRDLGDHFRFDTDNTDVAESFRAVYGDKPNHIRVMLMYATVEENLDCWKEHYSAGALKRRCDGQTCIQRLAQDGTYDFTPQSCECALLELKKPRACVPVGRLKVVIPELARMGYVMVSTTSIHDIIELQSNLEAAAALRGDLRGIPFVLSRRPRKVSVPLGDDGKRTRMEKWLLSLEPAPDWVRLQIAAMQRAALPSAETYALPAPVVNEETGEVLDEEPEPEPEEQPQPTLWKLTGTLSDVTTNFGGDGTFYLKAVLTYDSEATIILAKDEIAKRLDNMPSIAEVTLRGVMARNKKLGDYLDVSDVTLPEDGRQRATDQRANGTRLDDLETLYDSVEEDEKAQVAA